MENKPIKSRQQETMVAFFLIIDKKEDSIQKLKHGFWYEEKGM